MAAAVVASERCTTTTQSEKHKISNLFGNFTDLCSAQRLFFFNKEQNVCLMLQPNRLNNFQTKTKDKKERRRDPAHSGYKQIKTLL